MTERTFDLLADFNQFLVRDRDADFADLTDGWTMKAVEAMLVPGGDWIAVATARPTRVPVTVRVHEAAPPVERGDWDAVTETRLSVPSGELVVGGVTDEDVTGGTLELEPGDYDVRVCFAGLQELSEDHLSGDDRYVVELWPASR